MKYGPEHLLALKARLEQASVEHARALRLLDATQASLDRARADLDRALAGPLPDDAQQAVRESRMRRRQQLLDSPWGALVAVKVWGGYGRTYHAARVSGMRNSGMPGARSVFTTTTLCNSRETAGLEDVRQQLVQTLGRADAVLGWLRREPGAVCGGCAEALRAELRPEGPKE